MRIALFTLESLVSAAATRRFVADHAADIAFVGLSNAYRPNTGGRLGQSVRNLRRSGLHFVPYLLANFVVPEDVIALRRLTRRFGSTETTPLASLCQAKGIECLRVDDVRGAAVASALRAAQVDLIVSFHFDQIFDAATLALAARGALNVHPSLLPHHRGPVPTFYALLDAPRRFGVTVHRLVEKIDAGAVLAQEEVPMPADVTALGAGRALHEHGRLLLEGVIADFDAANAAAWQPETLPYCPFPTRKTLRRARAAGAKLADWRDFQAAFAL
jgi:folate-dependent phosphoribosylglycinamide formyltransferase PurN